MKFSNVQFSHGTLHPRHLLQRSVEYLEFFGNEDLLEDVKAVLEKGEEYSPELFAEMSFVWEDIYDYFNEQAADGYYFGCTEGDGSDIGWWRLSE